MRDARRGPCAATLLLVLIANPDVFGADAQPSADKPRSVGLKESVKVNLVQLEVTVWPKDADTDACLGLTKDDFDLRVDGKRREIYAVDSLGTEEETYVPPTRLASESSGGGLSIVLFFDLWHLDIFFGSAFDACPLTKPLAFSEARKFVREDFHDGDRLLLVTAAGWPVVHYGWIRTKDEALRALDRLQKNALVMQPRQDHLNHLGWIAGMESFFLALGRYPGRKDVLYLADDFRFDDVASRMYEIAARAQGNGVVMNAVDLLSSCRSVPGPGPFEHCLKSGGLGCTEFRTPVALNPLARDTGGRLFLAGQIGAAVRDLRTMRKCRYLVSFWKEPYKGKRLPSVKLTLKDEIRGLSLSAPSSFQTPERTPSQKERDEALFLLPRFGRGISAEVALWPYRPSGKRGRWKAFVLARVDRTDDEPWPDELTEIWVNVLPHKQSQDYGEYRKKIVGEDLAAFRAKGGTKLMLFPLEGIRPGETTVDLTVTSNVEEISANVRKSFEVPEPPGPGQARPWLMSDKVLRFGETEVLAPSMDDAVSMGEPVSFIGYGCHPKNEDTDSYTGRLVPSAGGASVPVPVTWLDRPKGSADGCGWLIGRVVSPAQSGLWTFEPPSNLAGKNKKGTAGVEFTVVSAGPQTALPAEAQPR